MPFIKKIAIIKGASQYSVMRLVCDEMALAFRDFGYQTSTMDLGLYSYSDSDIAMLSDYDMIFSIDAVGVDMYSKLINKPFFWTFLVDPPFYLYERLKLIDGNVMVSCVDRHHVNYIDKYHKNIPWTCFMPHGGIIGNTSSIVPYCKRKYNTIMMGSLSDIDLISDIIQSLKKDYDPIVSSIIDKCLDDSGIDLEDALIDVINEYKLDFNDDMFMEFMYILRSIDALRRHYKRTNLILSLLKNGLSVDIWGNGWDKLKKPVFDGLLHIHSCVEYNEANTIMKNAKMLLNDMPLFHDGSHERVFAAMQSGTLVATDRSIYFEECFRDKDDVFFYDPNKTDSLAPDIEILLNNPTKAKYIIDNAIEVSSHHTWRDRAASILDIATQL